MTAQELIAYRKRFHLTQEQCSAALGCSKRSIINWEKGTSPIPDSIALAASAFALNLPRYGDLSKLKG